MFRTQSRLQQFALWLALSGTLLRGLIPVGFMPAMASDADARGNAILVLCSGGAYKASALGKPGELPDSSGGHSMQACPFAASAALALPGMPSALPVSILAAVATTQFVAIAGRPTATHTRPPTRGPPLFSIVS